MTQNAAFRLMFSAILACHLFSVAQAQTSIRFLTAGDLYLRLMAPDAQTREVGRHYIMGVVDALSLLKDSKVCVGASTATLDLVTAVVNQLKQRPDLHRFNAASVVREAIAVEFPCV
jgi:hypothetical protein